MKVSNWCIYCTGASIKGRIEELKEYFKDWENTIAVNAAVLDFPSTYWAFLDSPVYDAYPVGQNRKIIVSRLGSARIKTKHRNITDRSFFHISDHYPSNSGIFAIEYALQQGGKNIVTCGFDLSDNWSYYNNDARKHSQSGYPKLMRESFRRLGAARANVYSVDPNNSLGLKFYDIEKGI